ncbi:C-5 sterol desaturase [Trichosporon asahii var. asahii CBS 8904]|uniref:C-5 sterol desaturase n=1 Tax=Trichosporon asahii var. asahii (strain CBS 8904) TaxID=1220162 RepID=K1VCA5_TRIAC|nr:C-5 sterol desaturase [Trichosporon asahii var. asahii CBS 8904]
MDLVLHYCDEYAFDSVYAYLFPAPGSTYASGSSAAGKLASNATLAAAAEAVKPMSRLARDSVARQCMSLLFVAWAAATVMYFLFCSISYYFFYDRRLEHHPRFLKNQIRQEIISSLVAAPTIDVLTLPWFLGEVRGYSMLYDNVSDRGWLYFAFSAVWFLVFTDFCIYWIHRIEHHRSIYKYIHKPHHKWIVPTPFAALAFHPLDGYAQSLPYHIFVYLFPMHRLLYLGMFGFVQLWTILIHDGDMIHDHFLEKFINSPAHHTLHHIYFTCNYGQYFTWADKTFDSHRDPVAELDPLIDSIKEMHRKGLCDKDGNPIKKESKKNQ